jgi:hypothetical protein
MTSGDESSEGFLQRWSRKKLDTEQREADEPKLDSAATPESAEPVPAGGDASPAAAAAKPEFDLSSLPSLESITAGTDIRAFLSPGVPAELARAALRRAWTADATIRDFVGLAENAWDFNDPNAMPGFGPLDPGYDFKGALAQMFGEVRKLASNTAATDQPATAQSAPSTESGASSEASRPIQTAAAAIEPEQPAIWSDEPKISGGDFVQRDNITAPHKSDSEIAQDKYKPRRNHGGALPP